MTLPLARECGEYGIRVMTIAPGIFQTPMMAGFPEKVREALGKMPVFPQRLGRPVGPEDVAIVVSSDARKGLGFVPDYQALMAWDEAEQKRRQR